MEAVYVIAILFTSWDRCYDFWTDHDKTLMLQSDRVLYQCTQFHREIESRPLEHSLRPKMRPEGLGDK